MKPEKTEKLLKLAAPYLKSENSVSEQPSSRAVEKFRHALKEVFSEPLAISRENMELLILKFFSAQRSDAFAFTSALRKAGLKLKDGGDGSVIEIINELEAGSLLAARWKAVDDEMEKIFEVTARGRFRLETRPASTEEMKSWIARLIPAT